MDESNEHRHQLRALAMRVAALENNVAFLEQWCEEQQDTLDRALGPIGYDYEADDGSAAAPRTVLRIVDLRDDEVSAEIGDDDADPGTIFALVETDDARLVHQIRMQLNRLRTRLATTLAPPEEVPAEPPATSSAVPARRPAAGRKVSAKPAGRTAP